MHYSLMQKSELAAVLKSNPQGFNQYTGKKGGIGDSGKSGKGASGGSAPTGSGSFGTHSEAMSQAHDFVKSKGYDISDDNWQQHVAGKAKPGEGKTNRYSIPMHKDGQETDKYAHIQVYNKGGDSKSPFELNAYTDSGTPKIQKSESGFAHIFKGARSGQPGAGGMPHSGMAAKDSPADTATKEVKAKHTLNHTISPTQTQSQRVGAYLSQSFLKPR